MSGESDKPDIWPKGARIKRARDEEEGGEEAPGDFCFVIMSFSGDPVLESYYVEGIKRTVEKLGLRCVRVDREHYKDRVSERIRDNIRKSVAIIVDLTEDRPNCYFEAGYAVALNEAGRSEEVKPPIIFQRLNAPPKYEPVIHFDVQDYPFILYTTVGNLRTQLREKLKALLGR
jgi:hypothetical protein